MIYKRKPPPGNVRRVRHIGKNIHGITTNKCGRLVQFESEQERKLILLLERDATVTDFTSQPETITCADQNGRIRQYTPDFQVWRNDKQIELHEVTVAQRRRTKESAQQREAAAHRVCRQRGWTFHVHTEETLPTGYHYANLDALAQFRSEIYADEESTAWWLAQLHGKGPTHPQDVLNQTSLEQTRPRLLNTLYHLLWHDQIQMNWDAPFIWRGTFHAGAHIWLASLSIQEPATLTSAVQEGKR